MNDINDTPPTEATDSRDDINVFSYIQVLAAWKKFLAINVLIVAVAAAALTLTIPNRYLSVASVLPPRNESGLGGTLSQLTKDFLPSGMLGKLSAGQSGYNFLAILESRTALEEVVRRFDLVKVYDVSGGSIERAVGTLRSHAIFDIEENGNISISVVDTDPKRAAAMANAFVDILNEISIRLGTQEARNNRMYIEKRYNQALDEIRAAEDSLKRFQQKYGIFSLPDQTKAALEGAAQLQAQCVVTEVELGILERTLGKNNPQALLKRSEIQELKIKLGEMKYGTGVPSDAGGPAMFVPFKDVPERAVQYLRLYRTFEIQSRIIQFTAPVYEQAKIDEQKALPAVLVLDRAVPTEKRFSPRRTLIILASVLTAFLLFSLLAFLMESLSSREPKRTRVEKAMALRIAKLKRLYRMTSA
jgi:tyrosine-protein kinase Etk/Wzc